MKKQVFTGYVIALQGREFTTGWKRYGNVKIRLDNDDYDGMVVKVFLHQKDYVTASDCHLYSRRVRFRGELLATICMATRIVNVSGFVDYAQWLQNRREACKK